MSSHAPKIALHPRGHLLRVLGVGFGVAVTVGNTIGSGLIRTSGEVAAQLPHPGLFLGIWALGGLYALVASFSFAELAAMLPRSGGHYVFTRHALGEYPGFVIGWSDWIGNVGSISAVAIVIAEYSVLLWPALAGRTAALACAIVIGGAILNIRGIRVGSGVQNLTALLKALGFLGLVAACFLHPGAPAQAAPAAAPQGMALLLAAVIALQAVSFTYDGWAGIVYFSEETKDPGRDVPRSIFGGLAAVIVIYLLMSAALVHMLPMPAIAGDPLAMGKVATALFGPRGDAVLAALLIVSLLSAMNAFQMMAPRVLYAMSRDGLFTRLATEVNRGGTPDVALLMSTAMALVFILSGTFREVVAILAFFFTLNYVAGLVSLIVLRRREPERPRPYRAWGYPWTTGVALVAYAAFLVASVVADWTTGWKSLLLLAASWPMYRLVKRVVA